MNRDTPSVTRTATLIAIEAPAKATAGSTGFVAVLRCDETSDTHHHTTRIAITKNEARVLGPYLGEPVTLCIYQGAP